MPFMPPMNDPAAMQAFFAWQQMWMAQMFAYSQQQAAHGMAAPMSPMLGGGGGGANPYGGMHSPQLPTAMHPPEGQATPGVGAYAGMYGAPGAYPTTPFGYPQSASPFGGGPPSATGGPPAPNYLGALGGVGSGLGVSQGSSNGRTSRTGHERRDSR
jgi:hypothetical protein